MQPNHPKGAAGRAPHPATVAQPRVAPGVAAQRRPHPATVAQPRAAPGVAAQRPPHPATVRGGPRVVMRAQLEDKWEQNRDKSTETFISEMKALMKLSNFQWKGVGAASF